MLGSKKFWCKIYTLKETVLFIRRAEDDDLPYDRNACETPEERSLVDFVNEKKICCTVKSVVDYLDRNHGHWNDFMDQKVLQTVTKVLFDLVEKKASYFPDGLAPLLEVADVKTCWKMQDDLVLIPGGVVGLSLADLVTRFKRKYADENEMIVLSTLLIK